MGGLEKLMARSTVSSLLLAIVANQSSTKSVSLNRAAPRAADEEPAELKVRTVLYQRRGNDTNIIPVKIIGEKFGRALETAASETLGFA